MTGKTQVVAERFVGGPEWKDKMQVLAVRLVGSDWKDKMQVFAVRLVGSDWDTSS